MKRSMVATILACLGFAGCAFRQPPVPVSGPAEDVDRLVGTWSGEYRSPDSGRSGEIYFRFTEGTDSAVGGVLMVPASTPDHGHPVGGHPETEYLDLMDVRVVGREVTGRMAPYQDPACGCQVRTVFQGTLSGGRIEGTYTTVHLERATRDEGRWWVARADARLSDPSSPGDWAGG